MNLRATILSEHSKAQTDLIIQWVGDDQKRFDELFALFTSDEYRVVQRAAWPVSYCVIEHPSLIKKHFSYLISCLTKSGLPIAVKRNIYRLLQYVEIPKKYQGKVMDLCFHSINSPNEAIAVKAFALTILQKLSIIYPEIKDELVTIIKDRFENETPAFRARARKILR